MCVGRGRTRFEGTCRGRNRQGFGTWHSLTNNGVGGRPQMSEDCGDRIANIGTRERSPAKSAARQQEVLCRDRAAAPAPGWGQT